jgi:hypothetical protein
MRSKRPNELPSSTAAEVLDGAVEAFDGMFAAWSMAEPRIRVRLGATMAASVILARGRMPAIPAVLAAVGVGVLAERAYVVVHDVHQAAIAIARETAVEAALAQAADDAPLRAFTTGRLPSE